MPHRRASGRYRFIRDRHPHIGDLNRVTQIMRVVSLVNSTPDFVEQHLVTNGASDLIADVFGDVGKHARSAFCVPQMPLGACVDIEMNVKAESIDAPRKALSGRRSRDWPQPDLKRIANFFL